MGTTKNATIRYHALDKCFGNHGRDYTIKDLVVACNEALFEFNGKDVGVQKRQVYKDIAFMQSDQGWAVDLEIIPDGKYRYYRYADQSFSINNKGVNPKEAEQLKEALSVLSRFKGMPQFEWVEEMQIRLEDTFKLKGNTVSAVSFEQNPFLKGLDHFEVLFNAITNQQALSIEYQGFKQKEKTTTVLHPWHLKQYNNRWFLFGFNAAYKSISNLAIDRIVSIENSKEEYIVNKDINFEEFFEDVVGVSVNIEKETEKVLLRISLDAWPYINSKPLHGSQKMKTKTEEYVDVELDVQINYELISLLFSHLDAIEILEPKGLRERVCTTIESISKKYF